MSTKSAVKRVPSPEPRPRGRPRSPALRAAALRAARALIADVGPAGVTMEGIAARAGVSKPTVYRLWPNAQAVVMAALMDAPSPPARPGRGSALSVLRRQVRDVVAAFGTRTGRNVTLMLAAADEGAELTKVFRHHFILARRDEGRRLLEAAVADGDVRSDVDREAVLDGLYGPIFFRILVGHAIADESFADRVVDQVLRGIAAPERAGRRRRSHQGKG